MMAGHIIETLLAAAFAEAELELDAITTLRPRRTYERERVNRGANALAGLERHGLGGA